jgi:two-component sensor histidine kinase
MNKKEDIHSLCLKFEKKLSGTVNPVSKIDLTISYCRNNYSSITSLLPFIDNGILISEKEGYMAEAAALKIYLAFHLWYSNKPKKAVRIIIKNNPILLTEGYYFEYALAQNIVSLIAWSKGELENAFETIYEGLDKVKDKQNNHSANARMNMTLAVLYYDLKELELSYNHYIICQKELHLCKVVYDYGTEIYTLIGLASISKQQQKYKKAKKLLKKSLELSIKYNMWMTIARSKFELGCIGILLGEDSNAMQFISESYEIRKEHNSSAAMVSCLHKMGELHLKLKNTALAKEKLYSALSICKKKKLIPKQTSIFLLLSKVYEFENDFESAYDYLKKYNALFNKSSDTGSYNKNKYLQYIYKTRKAEEETENQKQINAKLKEANEIITKQRNDISEKNDAILIKNAEKDILLKEIHHRVKNNLQIITSLLSLQSLNIQDPETKNLFSNSQYRINSMALIHEMLYQSDNLSKINYSDYLNVLLNKLVSSFKGQKNNINTIIDVPPLYLNINTAIPLGLLITEIITNSLKYAFRPEQEGILSLKLIAIQPNVRYILEIGDNGIGFSDDMLLKKSSSLGMKLISKLSRQINGTIEMDKSKKGTHYIITFDVAVSK